MLWDVLELVGIAVAVCLTISLIVVLYLIVLAAWLDYKVKRDGLKADKNYFKMIERFRRDFD